MRQVLTRTQGARGYAQALSGAAKEYSRDPALRITGSSLSPAPEANPESRASERETRGSPTARDRGLQWNNPRVNRVYRLPADVSCRVAIFICARPNVDPLRVTNIRAYRLQCSWMRGSARLGANRRNACQVAPSRSRQSGRFGGRYSRPVRFSCGRSEEHTSELQSL